MLGGVAILVLGLLLPGVVWANFSDTGVDEKRARIIMRQVGHQVLLAAGDSTSRVLPIEQKEQTYAISMSSHYSFEPGDMFRTVGKVLAPSRLAEAYIVEVIACDSGSVVHSFEVLGPIDESVLACGGRPYASGCYDIHVTLTDSTSSKAPNRKAELSTRPLQAGGGTSNVEKFIYAIFGLLICIGGVYYLQKKSVVPVVDNRLVIGQSRLNENNLELQTPTAKQTLSQKEADLLLALFAAKNQPIPRETLLKEVWGDDGDYVGRTLDVFVSKLRKKLEGDTSINIANVRGVGYKLVVE